MQVQIDQEHVWVQTPYHEKDFVASYLNGTYSKTKGMHRFPKNIYAMRELMSAFPQLQTDPYFVAEGQQMSKTRQQLLHLKVFQDAPGDERLRPYQRADVQYLKSLPAAGIFNDPRTGKTPVSIIMMKELGLNRNLVVCPAGLIYNWAKELNVWWPTAKVVVINGTPAKQKKMWEAYIATKGPAVLIVSKDTWKTRSEWHANKFDICFVDEAHFLRSLAQGQKQQSAQANAILEIKAKRRYVLTGTPTVKHPSEIYGILKFLYPGKFKSYWEFEDRYFEHKLNFASGREEMSGVKPHRQQELQELIGFISVQRKRKDVMAWLPDKQHINIPVKMDSKQRKLYDEMANFFMATDDDGTTVDTANQLAQLTRLRQICLDPRLLEFKEVGAKTKAILEWLDDNREPVVIMSMFTSYLKLLKEDMEKMGLKVGEIHGEMENKAKMDAATKFQQGDVDVLLCNIISAGTGFTLDRAESIIFVDKAWNPSDQEQAEDRITPISQDRNHSHAIVTFPVEDSVDKRIQDILDTKADLTKIVNHGGREAIRRLIHG